MTVDENIIEEKKKVLSKLRFHDISFTNMMIDAFMNVNREEFVLEKHRNRAYVDTPLPILSGQTISAIHMVMIYISPKCTDPKVGDKTLEVGAGSGYNAAMFAEMVAPKNSPNPGHVYASEIIPELAEFAKKNIETTGYSNLVTIIQSDGGLGYLEEAPYDIISVAAASKRVPPPLLEQLKVGGILVLPLGRTFYQELVIIKRESEDKYSEKKMGGVAFVPLTGKYG